MRWRAGGPPSVWAAVLGAELIAAQSRMRARGEADTEVSRWQLDPGREDGTGLFIVSTSHPFRIGAG
jgi:hypothetical protein